MKLDIIALATLTTLAAATPVRRGGNKPASECTTGPVQCCNSVGAANDPSVAKILGLLGIVVQDVNALVGLTCVPITVIGAGGATCDANPVCCKDNSHGGAVSIGCVPVDISL
ncbi:hypothetical protein VNI00_003710 [Paramarasmius palmivorus]|uniref:Hydrophobin n=1 Tax=Paramarasmius palmivorus TaxID=297713 RepID=A0AAW0DPZ1_9AGAR